MRHFPINFLQLLFRAALSLLVGFTLSFSSAQIFHAAEYTTIDLFFLIAVSTLAIAYLCFELSSLIQIWTKQARIFTLSIFGLLAFFSGGWIALSGFSSPAQFSAALAFTILIYAAMLPAIRFVETAHISRPQYFFAFSLSSLFIYGVVGFLDEMLQTPLRVACFTFILISAVSLLGYYLVRRAARSFEDGFLHKLLNIILCATLTIFFIAIVLVSAQFPKMFLWEYITIQQNLSGAYFASALISGVWGIAALNQIESRGYYLKLRVTKLFAFIKENLPGVYAGGMFFLINLIIARALNHRAFNYNSVLFETDAGPWMSILGSPNGDAINRAVHPLVLITTRPLIRLLGSFMGEHWNLAPILVVAAMSGLCVLMAWLFVKRATGADTYAFIFAVFLGSTSTHLLFGSLTENYVFGMTSLIFFFLLIQAGETRFSRLVPMGVIVFGITITNIAQTAIGLFFNKFGFWKTVRYCFFVIIFGVTLTVFTSAFYPNMQTFFFVPADLAFEGNFVKPAAEAPAANIMEKFQVVTRTMFLYGVVAPDPLIVISQKRNDPFPTIDLKTFDLRERKLASYKGLQNIPLALWLMFFIGALISFAKNARSSPHLPLMLGLLGSLAFNFLMHMVYGTELFLYTPYWTYALIFFAALSYAPFANKPWFEFLLAIFIIILIMNNVQFIFVVLRALAPFFAAGSP